MRNNDILEQLEYESEIDETMQETHPDMVITLYKSDKREVAKVIKKLQSDYTPIFMHINPKMFNTIVGLKKNSEKTSNLSYLI